MGVGGCGCVRGCGCVCGCEGGWVWVRVGGRVCGCVVRFGPVRLHARTHARTPTCPCMCRHALGHADVYRHAGGWAGECVCVCVCVWVVGLGPPTCMHAHTVAHACISVCVDMPSAMPVCTDMPSAMPKCTNMPVGGRACVCVRARTCVCGWFGRACWHARSHARWHAQPCMCRHAVGDAGVYRHAVGDADVLQALTISGGRQCAWQHA